ncbi:hypothetical protein E3N88_08448 [Mikania micrantha]|uniref:Phloem protein 2-like protein n=1 Tax=Mikania micrantha TaxID=192012 RepID=A0A5N6PGT9_9ASTR|nr:hypothetical protein E3N88_08448 [Mikania micrantha]
MAMEKWLLKTSCVKSLNLLQTDDLDLVQIGIWSSIAKLENHLFQKNINLNHFIKGNVNSGSSVRFWIDTWVADKPFKELFPDLYAIESCKSILVDECFFVQDQSTCWKWRWKAPVLSQIEALQWEKCLELIAGKLPWLFLQKIAMTAEPPLYYISEAELEQLMYKGVLLNGGKTWFSINKKGENYEMISFAECLSSDITSNSWASRFKSGRFPVGNYPYKDGKLKTNVKSQFLSPLTTYSVNLVFKFRFLASKWQPIYLRYRLQEETKTSVSYLAYEIEDGWWACELFQFTGDCRIVDLEILFDGFNNFYDLIEIESIEFRPMEKEEHKDENQSISDSDAYWEEKLPTDYEDIMKWSTDILQWTTKKEAYSIIRKGFLIDDGKKWFFLDKNGKKCHKLSAAYIRSWNKDEIHLSESRFKEATLHRLFGFYIDCEIQSHLLSPQTTYATYLVYKYLPENQSRFEGPVTVIKWPGSDDNCWYVYLVIPTTPVIRPKADQNTHNPVHRPQIKGIPQQRNDGWMEVQIWEFRTVDIIIMVRVSFYLVPYDNNSTFQGLVIQGFEVRPT